MKRSRLHDSIQSLPQGFDTWIGEGGLLILDQPTANLDALTEAEIFESLLELLGKRTVLLITHRLIGLENVDNILVMEAGAIIQRSRHDELAHQEGLYRDMWIQQTQDRTIEILR